MQQVLTKRTFEKNADIYRVMANPIRLHILNYLRTREASVTELTKVLKLHKANVSQHLAVLRNLRLVRVRRDGLNMYYRISDPRIVDPCRILHNLWKLKTFA